MQDLKHVLVVTDDKLFLKTASVKFMEHFPSSVTFKTCTFHEILEHSKENHPLLILIHLNGSGPFIVKHLHKVASTFHRSRIICAGNPTDVTLVLEIIKAGVKDFIKYPFDMEESKPLVEEILSNAELSDKQEIEKLKKGKVITVYSPKGGAGTTLLTSNLGVALAKDSPENVVLCDFAAQCGDIASYLNLSPKYTVSDLIERNTFVDISFLEGVMRTHHSTGVKVLPSPRLNQCETNFQHLASIEHILDLLKTHYETILIDAGHLDPTLLKYTLSTSDMVLLVGPPDIISLKGLIHTYGYFVNHGLSSDKIKLIINRHNSKNHIDIKDFEKTLNRKVDFRLPNQFGLCIDSVNKGTPLEEIQSHSEINKKINEIARMIQTKVASDTSGKHSITPSNKSSLSESPKDSTGFRKTNPFSMLRRRNTQNVLKSS